MEGESRLGPQLLPAQYNMDVVLKALLKVVRCNCKMGCDTLRCSCRKAGLDCSTDCGECRGICANMFEKQRTTNMTKKHKLSSSH